MFEVVAQLAAFYAVGLIVLTFAGFGVTRLLLGARDQSLTFVVSPLVGFCVIAIAASWLSSTFLSMTAATPVILAGCGALNAFAIWRRRFPDLRHQEGRPLLAVTLLAYVVGGIPLVAAGSTAFVGQQWDLELYLPIAEYLKRAPIGSLLTAPDSPLIAAMNTPAFRGGSGWGFSYVEALLGTVLQWMSYATFRPLLQLCFALGVPGVYTAARLLFKAPPRTSAVAAGLWGLNGFNLWLASSGLAGHAAAFFLIPLAVTCTVLAFQQREVRPVLLAAVAVSGMLLTYYTGAILIWAALSGAMTLPLLAKRAAWPALARTAVRFAVLVGGFAAVGHLRFLEVLPVYGDLGFSNGWNVTRYIPLAEVFGLAPDSLVAQHSRSWELLGDSLPVALDLAAMLAGLAGLAGLACAALLGGWRRSRYVQAAVAFALLSLGMRFLFQYPYGYFKVVSLISFVGSIALAHVLVTLWREPARFPRAARLAYRIWSQRSVPAVTRMGRAPDRSGWWRYAGGGAALAFVALLALNCFFTVRFFWPDRDVRPQALWELGDMKAQLPPGAAVYLPGTAPASRQDSAILAYFLLDNPLTGYVETAYGRLAQPGAPTDAQYVVLTRGREADFETGGWDRVWQNGFVALFRTRGADTGSTSNQSRFAEARGGN